MSSARPSINDERFVFLGRLGGGASGEVYLAEDRERDRRVAVKLLRRVTPRSLALFKQEFRSLAEVVHPNLVQFYELFAEDELWYFTMEPITGLDILSYIRGAEAPPEDSLPADTSPLDLDQTRVGPEPRSFLPDLEMTTMDGASGGARSTRTGVSGGASRAPARPAQAQDLERLRAAFGQLALGVSALHALGMLHRDIKPSNTLVTADGRVVLLDFGLIKGLGADQDPEAEGEIVGTPRYMSPEQAAGDEVSEASDWYSVGVMLYEILAGQPPFSGKAEEQARAKQSTEPPPIPEVPGIPSELLALCRELLARDPDARAGGAAVFERLGLSPEQIPRARDSRRSERLGRRKLIGRGEQLKALRQAFAASQDGHGVGVYIRGRSGMGKSFLMRHFVRELQDNHRALVLGGRCYQRESTPYKGWDDGMAAAARYLKGLPREESAACAPEDVRALLRIFPVLGQVETFADRARVPLNIRDPKEIQRRAFRGVKELLARISRSRPLVLVVDDLQWSDLDSAALFWEICKPPDNPAVLFLGTYRSDELASNPILREILERFPGRQVEVGGLEEDEVRALVESLVGSDRAREIDVASLTRESAGSPYFIAEMLRHAQDRSAAQASVQLDDMIRERAAELSDQARAVLEVMAVAGRPISLPLIARCLGLEDLDPRDLASLRAESLVTIYETAGAAPKIESYHDRIRESVTAGLAEERRRELHRSLAEALESQDGADLGEVAVHLSEAGESERAASYALRAAETAVAGFAFGRAAQLFRVALAAGGPSARETADTRSKLGEALTNLGRGVEAAPEFLAAAEQAEGERSLALRQRAAHQYFTSGHLEEGLEVMREVLAKVGMRLPDYKPLDLAAMVRRELRFRWRGSSFVERKEEEVEATKLLAIDTCWTVVAALATVDLMASVDFCMRMVLLALEAGEPRRIARALAAQSYMDVNLGRLQRRAQMRRARRLLGEAAALADRVQDPHALAFVASMKSTCAYTEGRFKRSLENCERALAIYREARPGLAWERDTARCFQLWNLRQLGQIRRFCERVPRCVEDAEQRRDLYALLAFGGINLSWQLLFQDRPEEAEERVAENLRRCTKMVGRSAAFHLWAEAWTETNHLIYRGRRAEAWERVRSHWPALEKLKVLEVQYTRAACWDFRGRAALAAAAAGGPGLPQARAAARHLEREPSEHGPLLGRLLGLAADRIAGNASGLVARLAELEEAFSLLDMALHAAVCRRQRGVIGGGEAGRSLVAEAERFMRDESIVAPQRVSALLAPGLE